jgi:Bacterial extracellular solute-binding protein
MARSRLIFLLIIGGAVLVVVLAQVLGRLPITPEPTPLPPLQIEVAVTPLAADWISAQATAFNSLKKQVEGQTVELRVTRIDGIEVWQSGGTWSSQRHPLLWVPEGSFALNYANEIGLRYEAIVPSLATTSLVWGIFSDRATVLGQSIDWDVIQKAAVVGSWSGLGGDAGWGFVKPAFALPLKSSAGLSALVVAAATFHRTDQLTAAHLTSSDFFRWLQPIVEAVPNFASLGQQPAEVLAARGISVADFGLLPEREWIAYYSQINARQPIRFVYPAYKLTFDLPLTFWAGSETTSTERGVAQQFADFLSQEAAQNQAVANGLRPAKAALDKTKASGFLAASGAGLNLDAVPGTAITMPSRSALLSLLNWFKSIRPA